MAHELFHTVNVYHHGEADQKVVWTPGQDGTVLENGAAILILREDGTDVTANVYADVGRLGQLGRWHAGRTCELASWVAARDHPLAGPG